MANDKDFRVKNGILVATDNTDLNSQGQIINSGSLGSFINFVDINTEFPETKATIGGNIDLDFSAYSYKINDNNMLWHGEGYVDTNTVVGKNAGTTTDYTSSNLTLLGHGAEPSSPTATNEVTLGDSNVKSFRIPGVGMSVDSTGLLTVNDISISGDITIDSDLVVNTIQVNDSARVTGNFTVDSDTLHVDATNNRVGVGTTSPAADFHVKSATYNHYIGNNAIINGANFVADTTVAYGTTGTNSVLFYSNNLERMKVTYDGKVGIGTTSPATALDVTGTITADGLNLGDNEKVQLGASNDLQIYAVSGNSYIQEGGSGSLSIRAADLLLRSPTDENYLVASNNGAVTLYYDNAAKIATTSTGVDVTGTITADQYNNDEALPTSNPSLSLDFGNSVQIDPRINFSRASIGTYFDGQYIRTAGPDEPRIEYDTDGTVKGLLIEELRENLVQYSEDFTDASWVKNNGSVSADATTAPSGGLADQYVEDTSNSYHRCARTQSVTSGKTYTLSVYAKYVGRQYLVINANSLFGGHGVFDIQSGNVSNELAGTANIEDAGGGWYRCSVTATAASTSSQQVYIGTSTTNGDNAYLGDGTSGIYLWGAQLEEGSFATSYIPTNGTEATREPDIAYMPVSEFNYNQSAGTVLVETVLGQDSVAGLAVLQTSITSPTERISFLRTSATALENVVATAAGLQAQQFESAAADNTTVKMAMAFTTNSVNSSFNGNIEVEETSAVMPTTISVLMLGRYSTSVYANGHIKSLKYWPQRLSDATLQAVTQG